MEPIKYMSSLLTFYLKGEISGDQNSVTFKTPNTILGLIPLGTQSDKIFVNQIASISTNFQLKFKSLLLGVIVAIVGLCFLKSFFILALILLILGANWIINAFEIYLVLSTTGNKTKQVNFFIFEKAKAELAEQQINALISNRMDDTNTRQQTNRIVDAINNK
jgi:hypothetical protein